MLEAFRFLSSCYFEMLATAFMLGYRALEWHSTTVLLPLIRLPPPQQSYGLSVSSSLQINILAPTSVGEHTGFFFVWSCAHPLLPIILCMHVLNYNALPLEQVQGYSFWLYHPKWGGWRWRNIQGMYNLLSLMLISAWALCWLDSPRRLFWS